jgi:hypothetical protein
MLSDPGEGHRTKRCRSVRVTSIGARIYTSPMNRLAVGLAFVAGACAASAASSTASTPSSTEASAPSAAGLGLVVPRRRSGPPDLAQ